MADEKFRVIFTERAWTDLEAIVDFWSSNNDPERGIQYAHDLPKEAVRTLSNPHQARSGKRLLKTAFPEVQELPVFK